MNRRVFFLFIFIFIAIGFFLLPRFGQPSWYHDFVDPRLNMWSSFLISASGAYGCIFLFRHKKLKDTSESQRNLWIVFFATIAISGLLSAYYHAAPDNFRLGMERLGLSIAFMSFFSLMLSERMGIALAPSLLLLGIASVFYWMITEQRGIGDIRFYLFVQLGTFLLLLFLFLLFPSNLPGKKYLYFALALYGISKGVELWDIQVYTALRGILSGHTLKHILNSISVYLFVLYLRCRCIFSPYG